MIIGLPGAGKTYFARHFSETFNAPLVCADKLVHEIYNKPDITPSEHKVVKSIAVAQAAELAKTKTTLLVDGVCMTRAERQQLGRIAAEKGFDTLLVWVQTDELTAKTRAMHRSNKRQGDEYNHSISQELFATLAKRFAAPGPTEDYVVISGKHPYSTQAKMVLRKLAAPRAEKAKEAHQSQKDSGIAARPAAAPRPAVQARRSVIIR